MEYSACRERGTKKKSKSPTGIEPMTFRTPVGRSNHWAIGRLVASIGHIYWVRGDTRQAYCWISNVEVPRRW